MKKLILAIILLTTQLAVAKPRRPDALREITLTPYNTVYLGGMIHRGMVDAFVFEMVIKRAFLDSKEPLFILINSGGGEVYAAMDIAAAIKDTPNIELVCSYCGSAAAYIFEATSKPRLISHQSNILMHEMYITHMTAEMLTNIRAIAEFVRLSDEFDKLFYTTIGITREEYMDHIRNRVWVLFGDDMLSHHLADKRVKISCDKDVAAVEYNLCP